MDNPFPAQLMSQAEEFVHSIVSELPGSESGVTRWDDTCIRYNGRTVATLEQHRHGLCLVVKVPESELPAVLAADGYSLAPYVGRYGWVCVHLSAPAGRVGWKQVREMVIDSYRLIARPR
jgi:predicted DNA-binding protein (MmcQ/YjbR family)